mgnify:CR=1 FL=1
MKSILLLTCEHADHQIPRRYQSLFAGAEAVLRSHRGWDPGALDMTRRLARGLEVGYHAVPWSRLLVEANRSLHHPRLWSEFTAPLPPAEKQHILDHYWRPHRRTVEQAIDRLVAGRSRVVHIGIHSFTPVLDGEIRRADVGLLYDPARVAEAAWVKRWRTALTRCSPELRVRCNYPYRGVSDGLTTALRRRYRAGEYLGIELELNQGLLAGPVNRDLGGWLIASLREALQDR